MMAKVSVDQLTEFLLYVKEVHYLVVNAASERTGRLCNVIFANDITGTRKAPDPQFAKGAPAAAAATAASPSRHGDRTPPGAASQA